ncbi:MAG: NAD(P)/FAD-dependent oxidoreductase [Candidatus Omnitrophica bacterium]|nr:NAD(P)/FAD-dependent oxidoreductase [Candidatus Omnitrophota bacterium]
MKKDEYDVIIIGAGIGGLVCGCYLAKAGLKVLIVERNKKVGGYCTSFKVKHWQFDACAHTLGNLSKGEHFYNILKDLGVLEQLDFVRHNPTDQIVTAEYTINFWQNKLRTIEEFISIFPEEEKQIQYFFQEFIYCESMDLVIKTRNRTFLEILDETFNHEDLKSVLSLLILGNLGVSAHEINAFTAIKHYRQFILDGGYYPPDGMHIVPELLRKRFLELGGEILLSQEVKRILIKNKTAQGIRLNTGQEILAQIIVSSCDARQTFLSLIGKNHLSSKTTTKINKMVPARTLFVVYLGLNKDADVRLPNRCNVWLVDKKFFINTSKKVSSSDSTWVMVRFDSAKKTCTIYANALFKSKEYWAKQKQLMIAKMINRAEDVVPKLRQSILHKSAATPQTLFHWTRNYKGAAYGWAMSTNQFMDPDFLRDKILENLFVSSHWSTVAQGIDGVAIVGEKVARIVFKRMSEINRNTRILYEQS